MDDDPLTHPVGHELLHGSADVVGEELPLPVAGSKPRHAAGLDLVHDGVVGVGQGGDDALCKLLVETADHVDGGQYSLLPGRLEEAGKGGAVLGVRGIEAVQQVDVGHVEHTAVQGCEPDVLGDEFRVGTAVVEEGALPRVAQGHDVGKARGDGGIHQNPRGIHAAPLELALGVAAALVVTPLAEGGQGESGVNLGQTDEGIGHAPAHGAGHGGDVHQHPPLGEGLNDLDLVGEDVPRHGDAALLPSDEGIQGDPEEVGQPHQLGGLGVARAPLPLADGLVADVQPLGQLGLGQTHLATESGDIAGNMDVVLTVFHEKSPFDRNLYPLYLLFVELSTDFSLTDGEITGLRGLRFVDSPL